MWKKCPKRKEELILINGQHQQKNKDALTGHIKSGNWKRFLTEQDSAERIWRDKHIGIFLRRNLIILLKGFLYTACDSRWLDLLRSASSLSDKISPLQWFSLEHILKYLQFMQGRHNKKRVFLPSSNQSCQDDLNLLPSQIYPSNSNMRAASVTYSALPLLLSLKGKVRSQLQDSNRCFCMKGSLILASLRLKC